MYATLRGSSAAASRVADAALERRTAREERALSTDSRGSKLLGVVNGLIGDALERENSELHQPMAVRVDGRPVAVEPRALAAAFPDATPRVAIFLHGLFETEHSWRSGDEPGRETYGERLRRDLGYTPVYVRFNSGRHVSDNGRSLADLVRALTEAWPVEVELIGLVGHSMGGLVSRSACHQAFEEQADWVSRVRHVVSLGTPHMGSPVAQAVHYASAGLDVLPETRPFANFLRRRSAGVRDLRQGSLVDEDWQGRDADALRAAAVSEVPLLEGANHSFVTATVTRSPRHPLGRLIGDTLVLVPSASGRGRSRRIGFRDEDGHHVGGTNHFALLNHPAVYERLREWLGRAPGAAEGAASA